jgi:hypothetical protein
MKKSCQNLVLGVGLLLAAEFCVAEGEATLDTAVQQNKEAAQAQQRIDALAGQTDAALNEYRQTLARTEDLRSYNDQIERLAKQQQQELASLTRQAASAQIIQQQIAPLLRKMVDTLDSFIKLDTPFLKSEREARLQSLQALLDRPDVSLPEKFRRVMEAYQVEAEYGRTIEAYTSALDQDQKEDEQDRTVNFLRVGRVALFYVTLDGSEVGYWDPGSKRLQPLPNEYRDSIAQGLRIARKEITPDLIKIPLSPQEGAP